MKRLPLLLAFLVFGLVFLISSVSVLAVTAGQTSDYLSTQTANLSKTYSTGDNSLPCLAILSGKRAGSTSTTSPSLLEWSNIFNTSFWIPVVPEQCVVCLDTGYSVGGYTDGTKKEYAVGNTLKCPYGNGQSVPLALNLLPHIAIRLYGLLASMTLYMLVIVFAVVGIRYMIGGLGKGGRYTDTAKNLRDVFSALIVTLTISTLFLQILYVVLKVDPDKLDVNAPCIPSTGTLPNGTQCD